MSMNTFVSIKNKIKQLVIIAAAYKKCKDKCIMYVIF